TDYNPLQIGLNQMYAVSFYPKTDNAYDLGYQGTGGGAQNFRWRQIHANNLNVVGLTTVTDVHVGYGVSAVGIITASSFRGDGSQLTGISGSQNVFQTVAVSGQSNVVADSTTDTLTLVAGSNMTITTNASSDTITFASSGGSSTPAYTDVQVAYELTNSSSSGNGWRINGNGFANSTG
ncbi:MAG: hypothetical protein VXY93_21125, partial [Pseudomonadota bacterium]|nr:hypothetical protein [Pseudomonadota bacterium]